MELTGYQITTLKQPQTIGNSKIYKTQSTKGHNLISENQYKMASEIEIKSEKSPKLKKKTKEVIMWFLLC